MSETGLFLSDTPWTEWNHSAIAGDASRRSYRRLTGPDRQSVILMIAPPELGEDLRPFLSIAAHLSSIGLCPPEILKADTNRGLAVISDLGPRHFANILGSGQGDELELYRGAVDCLNVIGAHAAPDGLSEMTAEVGAEMAGLFGEWFAPDANAAAIHDTLYAALTALGDTRTLSLRDFHAENLIWRGDRTRTDRVGLLDFQDAFLAHPLYDLASLLRDARREVADATVEALTDGIDTGAFATIAVQRNLRILGIFARLDKRDGKTKYRDFIPRVIGHLKRDLCHPDLSDLARIILPELS